MPRKTKIILTLGALLAVLIVALVIALAGTVSVLSVLTATRDFLLLGLQILGILLLLALTIALFRWLRRKPEGTLILPFEMVDGGEKEKKPSFDGKSISDSLNAELLRILQIHTRAQDDAGQTQTQLSPANHDPDEKPQTVTSRSVTSASAEGIRAQSAVSRPRANILFQGPGMKTTTENLTPSFADSVTIGVGGATVSIGRLLLAFKQISSNRDPDIIISGSLQRFGKVARLVARVNRSGKPLLVCEVSRPLESEDEIPGLVRDLAFKIWHETSRSWEDKLATSANTWKAFRYFSEALYRTQKYGVTGRIEDLREAATNCLAAVAAERGYQNLFYVCYNLARACFERSDYATAGDLFLSAIMIHDGATLEGEAKIRIADAFNGYGAALAWQGKHSDAERAFRQAIKIRSDFGDAYLNLVIALVDLGWRKAAKNELDKALRNELLELSPVELGDLYSSLGIRDKAMETYQRAIQAEPTNAYVRFQLGNLYSDQNEDQKAIREYKRAISLDSSLASAHNALGVLYDNHGRQDSARASYQDAIEADPEMALPHNNLGIIYDRNDEVEEAIGAYRRAIELDSSFAIPHYNLGILYDKLDLTNEAIVELEQAIQLDLEHASSREWLGFLYTKAGRLEEALKETKRALELDPTNRRLAASLAGLYKKLGLEAEHRRQLEIARKLPPQQNEDEYQQACFEALCGNLDEALRLLKIALDKRIKTPEFAGNDADFDFLQDDARFQELVRAKPTVM